MAFDMLGKSTNKDKVLSGYKDKNGINFGLGVHWEY